MFPFKQQEEPEELQADEETEPEAGFVRIRLESGDAETLVDVLESAVDIEAVMTRVLWEAWQGLRAQQTYEPPIEEEPDA